jgi:hypothetical protein
VRGQTESTVIQACADQKGTLRLLAPGASCGNRETFVSWNVEGGATGSQGVAGTPGPAGPQGEQGRSGLEGIRALQALRKDDRFGAARNAFPPGSSS